jgi:hypothetical protein
LRGDKEKKSRPIETVDAATMNAAVDTTLQIVNERMKEAGLSRNYGKRNTHILRARAHTHTHKASEPTASLKVIARQRVRMQRNLDNHFFPDPFPFIKVRLLK